MVEFFADGAGSELFELLTGILHQLSALVFVNRLANMRLRGRAFRGTFLCYLGRVPHRPAVPWERSTWEEFPKEAPCPGFPGLTAAK